MKQSKFFEPLAVHVASGHSIKAAAGLIGCAASTAYNLSADPAFRQRVHAIRTEVTFLTVGRLADAGTEAVDTLRELLNTSNEPTIRLNASKAILAALPAMTEFGELRSRIDEVEKTSTRLRIAP